MPDETRKIGISLSNKTYERVKELVENNPRYRSISHFVEYAVLKLISEETGEVVVR